MRTVAIQTVGHQSDLEGFVRLPYRLYADDPNWVAPLLADHRRELDRRHNPFFRHADAALFIALRDGRIVGRISAHTDERFNEFHSNGARDATGFWGFFECENDPAAASALFDSAGAWLADHGKATMLGPASYTLNDVAGLLVDGFDTPPVILMSYNPPYYRDLIENAGFEQAQDLWAYRLDSGAEIPHEIRAFAHTADELGFTFRTLDMHHFWAEVARFMEVYNSAWDRNWGFVPVTDDEMRDHAKRLRQIVDPELVIIAERDGATAGAGLTLPDVNEELVRYHGRLGPRGLLRMLYRMKTHHWTACRVFALGVKREYRSTGVGAHLYVDTMEAARRLGYDWGEMSWILESNDAMNAGIRHMGGVVYKTYRMYERPTSR